MKIDLFPGDDLQTFYSSEVGGKEPVAPRSFRRTKLSQTLEFSWTLLTKFGPSHEKLDVRIRFLGYGLPTARILKTGRDLKVTLNLHHPLKNSLLKQEIIGNFFNWDFTQSTPFPPSIQLYPPKFSTTVITWLILSNQRFQKLLSFYAYKTWQSQLFG